MREKEKKRKRKLFSPSLFSISSMAKNQGKSGGGGSSTSATPSGKPADPEKKSFASAVRNPSFGKEAKDSQVIFEVRLFAPATTIQLVDVIKELSKGPKKSSLFGVRFVQGDLVATFHDQQERNSLVSRGSIKVQSTLVSVGPYPPPASLGAKFFLCDVPMTATGSGVEKALEPLSPTKWLFEHYVGTNVRTGRVIFWTMASSQPEFLRVLDVKCPIKSSVKMPKSTSKGDSPKVAAEKEAEGQENPHQQQRQKAVPARKGGEMKGVREPPLSQQPSGDVWMAGTGGTGCLHH